MSLSANFGWKLHQFYVKNGDLEEEFFMEMLLGFNFSGEENIVCKLKKALYGLKQSSLKPTSEDLPM